MYSKTKAAKFLEKVQTVRKTWLNIMAEDVQFRKIAESKDVRFIIM